MQTKMLSPERFRNLPGLHSCVSHSTTFLYLPSQESCLSHLEYTLSFVLMGKLSHGARILGNFLPGFLPHCFLDSSHHGCDRPLSAKEGQREEK